jgi:hypothetical protein
MYDIHRSEGYHGKHTKSFGQVCTDNNWDLRDPRNQQRFSDVDKDVRETMGGRDKAGGNTPHCDSAASLGGCMLQSFCGWLLGRFLFNFVVACRATAELQPTPGLPRNTAKSYQNQPRGTGPSPHHPALVPTTFDGRFRLQRFDDYVALGYLVRGPKVSSADIKTVEEKELARKERR